MKKSIVSPKVLLCTLCIALGAGSLAVYADNTKPAKPPMKLQLDAKPIDRDTANRVSFLPIVKKTAPSVVYVFSSKKVRNVATQNPFFTIRPSAGFSACRMIPTAATTRGRVRPASRCSRAWARASSSRATATS